MWLLDCNRNASGLNQFGISAFIKPVKAHKTDRSIGERLANLADLLIAGRNGCAAGDPESVAETNAHRPRAGRAAMLHAADDFLPDIASLGEIDPAELIEIRFMREGVEHQEIAPAFGNHKRHPSAVIILRRAARQGSRCLRQGIGWADQALAESGAAWIDEGVEILARNGRRIEAGHHRDGLRQERECDVGAELVSGQAGQKVLVRRGSDLTDLASLAGHTVCAPKGTSSLKNLETMAPAATPVPADNHTGCLVLFQTGAVDAITGDDTVLAGLAAQDPYAVVTDAPAFTQEPYGVAVKAGAVDLVQFVNALLEQMRADGRWAAMYATWLAPTLGAGTGQPAPNYGRAP